MKIGHKKKTNQEEEIKRNFESHFFKRFLFFEQKQREIKTKEPRYFSKKNVETKKNSKMFLKIMHDKTILKAKIDDTQEKQGFKNGKKSINVIF